MAPVQITEDYYHILEIDQKADQAVIASSYKRLALKLHPDRNKRSDAKEAFQKLQAAYETLKEASSRRSYDLLYPSIVQAAHSAPKPQPNSSPSSASKEEAEKKNEAAQIAALEKSKRERQARWSAKKSALDAAITVLERVTRGLEQDIKGLNSIFAAEAAVEAKKNSWTTWILSPLYKKPAEDSEEEKERKNRERQERRIQRDMKERRLASTKGDMKTQQDLMAQAQREFRAAVYSDDLKIEAIYAKARAREERIRQEKARVERERQDKIRREQQEKLWKAQEVAEALRRKQVEELRKRQAEANAAALKQAEEDARRRQKQAEEDRRRWQKEHEEQIRRFQKQFGAPDHSEGIHAAFTRASCIHDGWWPKVHGRAPCPQCSEVWKYLLQCPSCPIKACPRCQSDLRPSRGRGGRAFPRAAPRFRTPSPPKYYDDWD